MSICHCRTRTGYCNHNPRPVSPKRGSAKRRAKAIKRREWVADLRRRWDYYLDRIPSDATRVSICPCGARAWSTDDTVEDQEFFDNFDAIHADCEATS
jgi:hypothetical protein